MSSDFTGTVWQALDDDLAREVSTGAAWLASASPFPRSVHALWSARPGQAQPLPCGTVFDAVSVPALFGRRMLARLLRLDAVGRPGSGPVAADRGRLLFFAAPGTAGRLPVLLRWEEWQHAGPGGAVPALLAYGTGDVVPVPAPPRPGLPLDRGARWLVGPDACGGWLPGAEQLLWAAVRAVRAGHGGGKGRGLPISAPARPGAKVYDVTRRR
ncbi:hypothetical protein [Streptomyces sp. JJ66]|uniref:hypothetical protein n=1 Tax=Streptomyces sp. JJ66 TaxID=2803843 RepID=UPI00214C1846|nr:hypothetical protein [Streptomyces sp. JJ66]